MNPACLRFLLAVLIELVAIVGAQCEIDGNAVCEVVQPAANIEPYYAFHGFVAHQNS